MSTYQLISSQVLGSSAASVTFSSIPSTYKDLVLRYSARGDVAQSSQQIKLNTDTGTNYSDTFMSGSGSTVASGNDTNATYGFAYYTQALSSATANIFGNAEIYIPNYAGSTNKAFSVFGAGENNGITAYIASTANLWRNTAAISSLTLTPNSGNFVTGSSFYLYGI